MTVVLEEVSKRSFFCCGFSRSGLGGGGVWGEGLIFLDFWPMAMDKGALIDNSD